MSQQFHYTFPASRGVQNGREYYSTMVPVRLLKKLFSFTTEAIVPEHRAQRVLNEGRAKKIARYVVESDFWVLPAITVSINAQMDFDEIGDSDMGTLHVPMDAEFLINDGQHRVRGLSLACEEKPDLNDESIAVTVFLDLGLKRSQTIFADINNNAHKPSKSINVLYDHRDPLADIVRDTLNRVTDFKYRVEYERGTVSGKSRKFWTLAGVQNWFKVLWPSVSEAVGIQKASNGKLSAVERSKLVKGYAKLLETLVQGMPEWTSHDSAAQLRAEEINCTQLGLMAIASWLNADYSDRLEEIPVLKTMRWSRSIEEIADICLKDGRIVKNADTQRALGDYIAMEVKANKTDEVVSLSE